MSCDSVHSDSYHQYDDNNYCNAMMNTQHHLRLLSSSSWYRHSSSPFHCCCCVYQHHHSGWDGWCAQWWETEQEEAWSNQKVELNDDVVCDSDVRMDRTTAATMWLMDNSNKNEIVPCSWWMWYIYSYIYIGFLSQNIYQFWMS
jgi:hypothetical protein